MFNWVGKVFRVKEWADWERTKNFSLYFKSLFEKFFKLRNLDEKPAADFQHIAKRYHLKEDDLKKQVKFLKLYALSFFILFILIASYGVYQTFQANFFIALVIFCISLIAISLAFRYHFYLTLIRHRRLNCSIGDWFTLTFKRE